MKIREIKFRGMSTNGNWYYGLLCHIKSENNWYISNVAGMPKAYHVRPETIGQFTVLKDKNGVEIYAGDIVKCSYGIGKVEYNENIASFMVYWIDDAEANSEFLGLERKMRRCREGDEAFEVIGNVYQNPELP